MKKIVIGLSIVTLTITLFGVFILALNNKGKNALEYEPTGFHIEDNTKPYIDVPEEWKAIDNDTMVVRHVHGIRRDTLYLEFIPKTK